MAFDGSCSKLSMANGKFLCYLLYATLGKRISCLKTDDVIIAQELLLFGEGLRTQH